MKKASLALSALATLGLAQPASAEAWCAGTLSASWVEDNGSVMIFGSWRGTHTQICNVKALWKGIAPEVCATWIAKMDAAVSEGRPVVVYYATETSCAALPTYAAAPAPGYVMLN